MSVLVNTKLDFDNHNRIINLAAATAAGQPVTFEQLNSAIEGVSWKDNVRVSSQVNVTIASPGATINGITLTNGDRVLLPNQTVTAENGIYIFNGSATPMTRSLDADSFSDLKSAVTTVDEGTSAGVSYRQTQVTGVIDTDDVIWTTFIPAAPSATETTAGIAELATQSETDAGTDDARIVTPYKLANYAGRAKRYSETIGDGSASSITVTHGLNTLDCQVYVREVGGLKREVMVEKQHTSVNSVTIVFDSAPSIGSIRVTVVA